MKYSNLKAITLVIPSFNRQEYIKRQIEFWRELDIKIEILDGSISPLYKNNSKFKSIRYWHIPKSIEKRFLFASSLIKTKYAALLSDDEFFLPSALNKCIQFLEKNKDYGSCKGKAVWFDFFNGQIIGGTAYPGLNTFHVKSNVAHERMIEHLVPYEMGTLWSVQRSEIFIANLKTVGSSITYKTASAGEMQISLISSYISKVKVIDEIMWFRSEENPNIWWSFGRTSFKNWWNDKSNNIEHRKFVESIVNGINLISYNNLLSQKEIYKAIDAYCKWIEKTFENNLKYKAKSNLSKLIIFFIGKKIYSQFKYFLLSVSKSKNKKYPMRDRVILHEYLVKNELNINYNDLSFTLNQIKKFHTE